MVDQLLYSSHAEVPHPAAAWVAEFSAPTFHLMYLCELPSRENVASKFSPLAF
jgi:hypothetical protein